MHAVVDSRQGKAGLDSREHGQREGGRPVPFGCKDKMEQRLSEPQRQI